MRIPMDTEALGFDLEPHLKKCTCFQKLVFDDHACDQQTNVAVGRATEQDIRFRAHVRVSLVGFESMCFNSVGRKQT